MKQFLQNISAWLASHPGVKNAMDGLVKGLLVAAATYILDVLQPQSSTAFTTAGLGAALLVALKTWGQHALDTYLLTTSGTTPTAKLAAMRSGQPQGGNAVKKIGMFLFFALSLILAGNANAWTVSLPKAQPITKTISGLTVAGMPLKATVNTAWQPAAGGETDLKLMPTAGLGIGTGENGQPSYGISVGEALILGRSTPVDGNTYNFSTYLGIDGLLYADFGPWINSNFWQPIVARGGFGIIGPDFMGTYAVPSIQALYDFRTGERLGLVDLTVNFGALENAFGTQVLKL